MTYPKHAYSNLEYPKIREFARNDPNALFKRFKAPEIIDEIQRVPDLLSYIQVIVDAKPLKGRFILTGSHQLS